MVTCADPGGGGGGGVDGPHPLLENQKFYGFLVLAFGPPAPARPPGIGWTPLPPNLVKL